MLHTKLRLCSSEGGRTKQPQLDVMIAGDGTGRQDLESSLDAMVGFSLSAKDAQQKDRI